MYRVSCKPDTTLYIAENKTLAGKEDRPYAGEALGHNVAVVFFETIHGGLVRLGLNSVPILVEASGEGSRSLGRQGGAAH